MGWYYLSGIFQGLVVNTRDVSSYEIYEILDHVDKK